MKIGRHMGIAVLGAACAYATHLQSNLGFVDAAFVNLGSAQAFAILAGSTVTNTGDSEIIGSVGVWPGTAITGFPPGIVTGGTIHAGDAVAETAQDDLTIAYNFAAAQECPVAGNLTGVDLGGQTLTAGVYCFDTSAQLTGTLTLDAEGDAAAVFIFQMGSTLTTASASAVVFANGGEGSNLFWQVGSSATLGSNTLFTGNILALASITLNDNASIQCGAALARTAAVTLIDNDVTVASDTCESPAAIPEPSSAGLLGLGLLAGLALFQRQGRRNKTPLDQIRSVAVANKKILDYT